MIVSTKHKLERVVMLVVVWNTVLTVSIRPGQEPLKLSTVLTEVLEYCCPSLLEHKYKSLKLTLYHDITNSVEY